MGLGLSAKTGNFAPSRSVLDIRQWPLDAHAQVQVMVMCKRMFLILCAGLVLMNCGGDAGSGPPGSSEDGQPGGGPLQSGSAIGPGISIEQALASNLEGPLLVNGWLWRSGNDDPRLCASLSGSQPPTCDDPSLAVKGLDLGSYVLRAQGSTVWSDQTVQLLGTLNGKVLTVSPLTR